MPPLSASALLDLWEHGHARPPAIAALSVLAAASGETAEAVAELPVGTRDRRLMALHRELRGPRIEGLADCPSCGEKSELELDLDAIAEALPAPGEASLECTAGDERAMLRLPSTHDLLLASATGGVSMRAALLRRCLAGVWCGDAAIDAHDASPALLDAAEAVLAAADPASDIELALTCPACARSWSVSLDISTFVWKELEALVQRIADEVHWLASAYGWREADILGMSAVRRQLYIRQACE